MPNPLHLFLASVLVVAPALAQQTGDWMLAPSPSGGYLVPGTVRAVSGQSVTLAFGEETRSHLAGELQPLAWTVDSKIECATDAGEWQDVTIMAVDGAAGIVTVRPDTDPVSRRTGFARCRVPTYP